MDLNKVMIIGRITQDPEVRTIPSGQAVVSFGVATNRVWNDQQGQRQEQVEFHNVVAWRRLAEVISQYCKKGSRIYIEGRLQTRSWEDQNGVKKYRTEIIAENMIMLDARDQSSTAAQTSPSPFSQDNSVKSQTSTPQANDPDEEISVEDIPF